MFEAALSNSARWRSQMAERWNWTFSTSSPGNHSAFPQHATNYIHIQIQAHCCRDLHKQHIANTGSNVTFMWRMRHLKCLLESQKVSETRRCLCPTIFVTMRLCQVRPLHDKSLCPSFEKDWKFHETVDRWGGTRSSVCLCVRGDTEKLLLWKSLKDLASFVRAQSFSLVLRKSTD